jgi:hypothetical protein
VVVGVAVVGEWSDTCSTPRKLYLTSDSVAPFPDCNAILRSIAIIAIFVTITSGYLFLVRVRAIFHGHRWLLGLFTLLWVAVGATSLLVPFSVSGHHIEGSQQCIPIDMHPRTGVYAFIYIVNHVLIFICTSWKLVTIQHGMNGSMRNILRGQGFSNISAVLWSSGQLYFLYVHVLFTASDPNFPFLSFALASTLNLNLNPLYVTYQPIRIQHDRRRRHC